MPKQLKGNRLGRSALVVVFLLSFCNAYFFTSTQSVLATSTGSTVAFTDPGDNYPTKWRDPVPQDSVVDDWGEYNRECTSWASFALSDRNHYKIPFHDYASNWGARAKAFGYPPDNNPAVGAIAWWTANAPGASQWGHVAWVSNVDSSGGITIEQYNADFTGHYSTAYYAKGSSKWPTGFIHFPYNGNGDGGGSPQPSTPAVVSRTSTSMDLFYNDGYNHIVNYFWGANGWQNGYWSDNNIAGQPTVIDRTSNNLDVFYRTSDRKLEYRAWTASNGWGNAVTMVSSGVSGDPWAVARGSNDMQIFFLYNSTQMASINWDINNGWNLIPQILYNSGAMTDPVAISRSSTSMDVFFGKNNGNLVHLGWDPVNGWLTSDFSAGSGVDGRPTAIFRNNGNDMSAYYKEKNSGKVAEEFWDINNGWGWQDWNASLSGIPSAIPGINNTIDNFYRETGGNIVDRYFSSCGWCTTNIVGSAGSTGNPTAIVRGGTSIEVFYWNGSSLIDNNWNTTSQSWNGGAQIN